MLSWTTAKRHSDNDSISTVNWIWSPFYMYKLWYFIWRTLTPVQHFHSLKLYVLWLHSTYAWSSSSSSLELISANLEIIHCGEKNRLNGKFCKFSQILVIFSSSHKSTLMHAFGYKCNFQCSSLNNAYYFCVIQVMLDFYLHHVELQSVNAILYASILLFLADNTICTVAKCPPSLSLALFPSITFVLSMFWMQMTSRISSDLRRCDALSNMLNLSGRFIYYL